MLLSVFEKYIFLQSLGWGIANSFWQVAILWLIYKIVTTAGKNISSLVKHYFSLLLLFSSFAWFTITIVQNYLLVKNSGAEAGVFSWMYISEDLTNSLQWLSIGYLGLLVLHFVQFIKRLKGLYALKNSRFLKANVDTRIFAEQTALHMGIRKKVSVWLSEKVDVPSVIGFLKPMILLPVTALNNLTQQQAEAVILHELAHIKRNDYLVNLLQSFIELILFFNPFARLLGNVVRKERENCCDDWVLNYRYNKHDYASALLTLEQNRFHQLKLTLAATNGKKNLLGRVKRLFAVEPQINISFIQQVKLCTAALLILFGIFFTFPLITNQQKVAKQQPANPSSAYPLFASLKIPVSTYEEIKTPVVIDEPVLLKTAEQKIVPLKKIVVNRIPEEIEYNTALINDELLNTDKQLQEIAVQAANKGAEIANTIIVKIEEERSGIKDKKTYLLELKNNNGTPEMKPLIILNKKIKAFADKIKTAAEGKLTDSINATLKKRITS